MSEAAASETGERPDSLQTIIEAGRFQTIIEVLRSVADECIFRLGRDGLTVRLVDPATVYMVELDASAQAFDHVGEGSFHIGVDLERLEEIIGKAEPDELVHFVLDVETRKFVIEFSNVEMEIAGIDPETVRNEPDVPDNDYPAHFEIDADRLERANDIATLVSSHVDLIGDPEAGSIELVADGDTDDASVDLTDEVGFANVEGDEVISSCFSSGSSGSGVGSSSGYLTDALDVIPSDASEVEVELGDEMPLVMRWSFADGDIEVLQFIAPRLKKR